MTEFLDTLLGEEVVVDYIDAYDELHTKSGVLLRVGDKDLQLLTDGRIVTISSSTVVSLRPKQPKA